jgi:hypothetical protein
MRKLIGLSAIVLILSASGAGAQYRAIALHHRTPQPGYAERFTEGRPVGAGGWRLRSNARGWDNTCFDLTYLPSEFACSAN